jgi:putative SOS response-associated peptidase YedK
MCGRFVGNFSTDDLLTELGEALESADLELVLPSDHSQLCRNFNTAPTQAIPVLRREENKVLVDGMLWGLLPVWSKDASSASKMINARSETVTEKPSYRGLVQKYRCIIPMNGFYEWERSNPKAKVPYFVPRADGKLMFGAGLWTTSPIVDNNHTCTLITRESFEDLSWIHNRSPVQFDADDALEWLTADPAPLEMMWSHDQPVLAPRRVSTLVNSVRNNGPELIEEVHDDAAAQNSKLMEPPVQDTLF